MSEREYLKYEFGPFILDIGAHQLLRNGTPLELEPKEFNALVLLISKAGQLVENQEFMNTLWADVIVEDGRRQQVISGLRKKLGDDKDNPSYILTVPKIGYRFIAKVRAVGATDSTVVSPIMVVAEAEHLANEESQNLREGRGEEADVPQQAEENPVLEISQPPTKMPESRPAKPSHSGRLRKWVVLFLVAAFIVTAILVAQRVAKKPEILAINPSTPLAIIGDQSIVLTGRNFQKGATVRVIYPLREPVTLEGNQVQFVTETSLIVLPDFMGHWGKHAFEVHNPYGRTSAPFNFEALKHIQSPTIEAMMPESPEATDQEESIVVYGHDFGPEVLIEIIFPNEKSATLQGRQIPYRRPTAVTMLANFSKRPGIYKVRARNANGTWSEPFPFTVHEPLK